MYVRISTIVCLNSEPPECEACDQEPRSRVMVAGERRRLSTRPHILEFQGMYV